MVTRRLKWWSLGFSSCSSLWSGSLLYTIVSLVFWQMVLLSYHGASTACVSCAVPKNVARVHAIECSKKHNLISMEHWRAIKYIGQCLLIILLFRSEIIWFSSFFTNTPVLQSIVVMYAKSYMWLWNWLLCCTLEQWRCNYYYFEILCGRWQTNLKFGWNKTHHHHHQTWVPKFGWNRYFYLFLIENRKWKYRTVCCGW